MLILSETENIFLVFCIHSYHLPGKASPAEDATQGRQEHPSCDAACTLEQPLGMPLPSSNRDLAGCPAACRNAGRCQ